MLLPGRRLLQESWPQVRHVQTKGGVLPRLGRLALPRLAGVATAATTGVARRSSAVCIASAATSNPGRGLCRVRRALPRAQVLRGGVAAMLQAHGQAVRNVQEPTGREDRLRRRWVGLPGEVGPVASTAVTAHRSRAPGDSVPAISPVTIAATHGTSRLRQLVRVVRPDAVLRGQRVCLHEAHGPTVCNVSPQRRRRLPRRR